MTISTHYVDANGNPLTRIGTITVSSYSLDDQARTSERAREVARQASHDDADDMILINAWRAADAAYDDSKERRQEWEDSVTEWSGEGRAPRPFLLENMTPSPKTPWGDSSCSADDVSSWLNRNPATNIAALSNTAGTGETLDHIDVEVAFTTEIHEYVDNDGAVASHTETVFNVVQSIVYANIQIRGGDFDVEQSTVTWGPISESIVSREFKPYPRPVDINKPSHKKGEK